MGRKESNQTSKQTKLPKGFGVVKFYYTKVFKNQLFSESIIFRCKGIISSFLITYHSESILKFKII